MSRLGAALFDRRGLISPILVVTAFIIGGAQLGAMIVGALMLTLHVALRMWAGRHMGGAARVHARKAQERKVLVTGGPFRFVRNPLYIANTIGITGACLLFAPPWFAGVAVAASLLWYSFVARWEEGVLTQLYGDEYRAYCAEVPRFVPRLHVSASLPSSGMVDLYPWAKVLRRERGSIALQLATCSLAVLRDFPF